MEQIRYEDSGIDERIIKAVKEMGYETMTPIQQQAIPVLLEGKDVLGLAQTGTGKTAAFGIPMIQNIDPDKKGLQCIVLCPTRELAIQAAEELRNYAKFMHGIKVLPIYGGQDINKQIRSLSNDVSIVVGTPGRVMDHMRRHTIKLNEIKAVVLDEADEMLNMGFREDIEKILEEIPEGHQTALFSATMPQAIHEITRKYQKADVETVKVEKKELTVPLVKQYYYEVRRQNKEEVIARLIDYYNPKLSLIFCNTKRMVDDLTDKLKGRGYFAEALHGDLSQYQRDVVMRGFRTGNVEILVATDVAARGIDVDNVEAVFNYDIPQDIEYYVHRIGRTGRAGRSGRAFSFVFGKEIYKIKEIERICNTKIKAKVIPSAADITAIKADKLLSEVLEVIKTADLTSMIKLVEDKIDDEDITSLELAAGFLKLKMGDPIEELPVESFKAKKENRFNGRSNKKDFSNQRDFKGKREFKDKKEYKDKKEFKDKKEYKDKPTNNNFKKTSNDKKPYGNSTRRRSNKTEQ